MHQERAHGHAETFSKKSGTLMSTQFIEIGYVKTAKIQVVLYRDLISEQNELAIRFENEYYDGYSEYPDTKIGMLDKDEVEGLIKSINIIRNHVFSSYPEHYTEVNFISRTGFKAGCFSGKDGWSFYLKLDQYDDRSFVWLKKEDSATILELLTKSRDKVELLSNNI